MQPGDLMMYDGEILCLVLEMGVDFYGSKRVRVQPCGDEASRPFHSYRLCPEILVHTTDLEPVNEAR